MKPFKTPAAWLSPIRASHLIQLDYYDGHRNFIHIWLPEAWMTEDNQSEFTCVLDRTEDRHYFMQGDTLVTTYEESGFFKFQGEVSPIEDGVSLKLSLTNQSENQISRSTANVCVQFAAAPSFSDYNLERYFYVTNGEIYFVKKPYFNFENNHTWFYGTYPDKRFLHNPLPDFGFIGLASKDGHWVIGHGWDSTQKIFGNCHPSLSCIHADPHFGPVSPFETVESNGILYIMRGKPEDSVARFNKEFLKK